MDFPFKIIDLSHILEEGVASWNGSCGFKPSILLDYKDCQSPTRFRVQALNLDAGIGTHMDAPAHCIDKGKTIDQIPIEDCLAPCVVLDLSKHADQNFKGSLAELEAFEKKQGQITPGSFVIIRTGWDKHWNDAKAYRNDLQFPSVSHELAEGLLERDIVGLGIDTLSPDTPDSGYPVHQTILGAGKYLIENIANSTKMPLTGAFILALPLPARGLTEAPLRLIGLIPQPITSVKK